MSIRIHGSNFYCRFKLNNKSYERVCKGCKTLKEAEAFEAAERLRIGKEVAALKEEERRIRQNKTVVALIENYKQELTGAKPIPLAEAYELAVKKPSKREPSRHIAKQKRRYWYDFVSYMSATYPDISTLDKVRKLHCEAYVRYLIDHGRFNQEVRFESLRHGKTVQGTYKRTYKLAGKTIHEIARVCNETFTKLSEDAGLILNPWSNVITPEWNQTDREIFSERELILIKQGIYNTEAEFSDFCRPLFLVAAVTGLTEGDICTLKWDEISWSIRMIFRKRRKTGVDMAIPILGELETFLREIPHRGEYVFPEHAEMYLKDPTLVSYRVKRFLEKLGIRTTRQFKDRKAISTKDLHSMRHVFCYYAGQAGIPLATVQAIVGHMTPEMTKHYMVHSTIKAKHEAIAKLPTFLIFNIREDRCSEDISERQRLVELAYSLPLEQIKSLLNTTEPKAITA